MVSRYYENRDNADMHVYITMRMAFENLLYPQAVADEDENGFDATKGATFLQTVYEPTFTAAP